MKVLISPGFGAGWSTYGCKEMATDKELIELFEKGCTCEQMRQLLISKNFKDVYGGYPYMGGFGDLTVEEVPPGRLFKINEYDGAESIEFFDEDEWFFAED